MEKHTEIADRIARSVAARHCAVSSSAAAECGRSMRRPRLHIVGAAHCEAAGGGARERYFPDSS